MRQTRQQKKTELLATYYMYLRVAAQVRKKKEQKRKLITILKSIF